MLQNRFRNLTVFAALLALWFTATRAATAEPPGSVAGLPEPEACAECHAEQAAAWQTSHHALAMAPANQSEAMLGDFDDASAAQGGLSATFRTVDNHPVMSLTRNNKTTHHVVSHAFGAIPLQQYLTETQNGYRQVLPFAWDTRTRDDGGQRWITLHPDEDIEPADRLHWQQPLSNWNGMCADCHSTGLTRNFSITQNTPAGSKSPSEVEARFDTRSRQVNVSCGSCHGEQPHEKNPIAKGSGAGFAARYAKQSSGDPGSSPNHSAESQHTLDICAGCHSLRSPLVDGIDPAAPFLDQFAPTLPNPTLYFPDGQIREEVYVWGSFLQSRMHKEGVTCGNCHDPHSQQLRAKGNALCGQCHASDTYDNRAHHQHALSSTGAQCINCHMASRTYMVVDDRRDHSFRVPDLGISQALGTPDPCTGCHRDKTQQWAEASLQGWPEAKSTQAVNTATGRDLAQHHQAGMALTEAQLSTVIDDQELPEITRAAAIDQQTRLAGAVSKRLLSSVLAAAQARSEPLITFAAVNAATNLPLADRQALLAPLLDHEFRVIRIAAANQLRDTLNTLNAPDALQSALTEANTADQISSWRGEGLLNIALNAERQGAYEKAAASYQRSIDLDPYFEPSYINLAELHRRQGDIRREQLLYAKALKALPKSTILRYSYALHLVRRKEPAKAVQQTKQALTIDPANPGNAYLHLLLLDSLGQTETGIQWLRDHLTDQANSPQVLQIGAKQAQKQGDSAAFSLFAQALQKITQ